MLLRTIPLLLLLLAGCGGGSGDPSNRSLAAGSTAATTTAGAPGALNPAFGALVARTFAPQLRYNAFHADGNPSRQNRNEDFFPMGVASFLSELQSGSARVLVQSSTGPNPGVSQARAFATRPTLKAKHLEGYPRFMVGDEPGTAPTYVHAYEDVRGRVTNPDGSGALVLHVEYWFFYAYDRAESVLLQVITTSRDDITGHRADWEHVSFRIEVQLGPGGTFAGGDIEHGTFYGHFGGSLVSGSELERVDDAGDDDPTGRHPVVYVAQGKHAAYPEAGEWTGHTVPSWVAIHTDFFRGNGVRLDTWTTPLLDLEDPASAPQEFSPPAFTTLVAGSPGTVSGHTDWTTYAGRWGPDLSLLNVGGVHLGIGLSPDGPKVKANYGDFGGLSKLPRWRALKASEKELKVYKDLGVTIPRVLPAPAPIRQ